MSMAQTVCLANIRDAVSYFIDKMPSAPTLPNFETLVKSKRLDYNGDEAGHAVPMYSSS